MKHFFFLVIFLTSMVTCFAQTNHQICHWDGDKKASVVLTFDDWTNGHPKIVVPALKERNFVGTFYFITKDLNATKIKQLNEAINYGNEIGNHTYSHPQKDTSIAKEVRPAKEQLDNSLENQTVLTFDYPYGTVSQALFDTVRKTGHIAARGVWSPSNYKYNFATKDNDYYNITTVSMGTEGVKTTKNFASYLTKVINGGGLLTYLYHAINESGWSNVPKDSLYAQLDTLLSLTDKVWVTTLANAVKYHREANCATLMESKTLVDDGKIFLLTDTLPDSIYNYPLTLKIYNEGNTFRSATQNDNEIEILYQNDEYALVRAVPDAGEIVLKWGFWESIVFDKKVVTAFEGESFQIDAAIHPEGLKIGVIWSSSNEEVAIVNNEGLVCANKVGKAVIHGVSTSGDELQDSCLVIVKRNPIMADIPTTILENSISISNKTIIVIADENSVVSIISSNGEICVKQKGSCQYTVKRSDAYIISIDEKSQKIFIR